MEDDVRNKAYDHSKERCYLHGVAAALARILKYLRDKILCLPVSVVYGWQYGFRDIHIGTTEPLLMQEVTHNAGSTQQRTMNKSFHKHKQIFYDGLLT